MCLSIAGFWIVYDTPARVKFLTPEEQRFLLLRHKFSAGGESGVAEDESFSWNAVGKVFRVSLPFLVLPVHTVNVDPVPLRLRFCRHGVHALRCRLRLLFRPPLNVSLSPAPFPSLDLT